MSEYHYEVSQKDAGLRLDVFLSRRELGLSRNQVQRLIELNHIRVEGVPQKASYRLRIGEQIAISLPPPPPIELVPEPINLDILFEDEFLIAVNKPPALVVHPAAGHREGTLVHGLVHHCRHLADLGGPLRPGIVHRLDKDTSGILVVAKNNLAYRHLSSQFKEHSVYKEYTALVHGRLPQPSGSITAPIHRHPKNRKKMGILAGGREAFTSWWLEKAFAEVSLVKVVIKTGRTHQIRVHFAHANYPLVGDGTYGGKKRARNVRDPLVRARITQVKRQMLHARRLALEHPGSGELLELSAPLPEDMGSLIRFLEQYGEERIG
ncbi:MAG: RluA family pseudouridine synthase [Deltaproteobacteria bacterium]|nr:MAG: RluA family pseudouridine synthase [Deltaproteobacteria bacterium]